jgi:hypothetical protein
MNKSINIASKKKKTSKKNQDNQKILQQPRNILRESSQDFSPFLKKWIGNYYIILHNLIAFGGLYIFFFSNSLSHLVILLNIIILDCISIVFIHDCPLTMLEQKYLSTSMVNGRQEWIKSLGICYGCDHEYEKQLEVLINMFTFVCLKIFCVIFHQLKI